ncbi:MAG: hypothetical protein HOH29_08965 [Cellvibrionales bacterium]|jgi:hypothetical protein|nr:hypothetical protein [Cellvibrionales bacterium]
MMLLMTLLTLLLAWLGSAAVALAILRRGLQASANVFLFVLLLAAAWAYTGNIVPLSTLLCSSVLAVALRTTSSWSIVVTFTPFVIIIWAGALLFFASDYVALLLVYAEQGLDVFKQQLELAAANGGNPERAEQMLAQMPPLTAEHLLGNLAFMQMLLTLISLFAARWWQAKLYNPGGFQQEFYQLRLSRTNLLVLAAGLVLFSSIEGYHQWAWLFAIPIIIVGIALVHALVALKQLSRHWLFGFYVIFITFAPVVPLLMMAVIADSALDFRLRLTK